MTWLFYVVAILFFVTWTLLIGFVAQQVGAEKERKRLTDESASVQYLTVTGEDNEDLRAVCVEVKERLADLDAQVQHIDENQKSAPANVSPGEQRRLEEIEPLMTRVDRLEETVSGFRDRFTRVERKAGMRV